MELASREYPKILFVNDFPPDSLSVILFRQLLAGYPRQKIAWWSWRNSGTRVSSDLPVESLHRCWLPHRLVPHRKVTALKSLILERVWVPAAAQHLRRTISSVKPDLVWMHLYSWLILVAQRALPEQTCRLHVSVWDFPDIAAGQRALGLERSQRFIDGLYRVIRQADSCDTISQAMMEEIAAQTGRQDTLLVHSGLEPDELRTLENSSATAPDALRIAYVGSIISEKSFLDVLSSLEKVRCNLPQPLILEFFGARGYNRCPWFNPQWMVEHPPFSDTELVKRLQTCCWGIVVMDLDGEDLRYSRFSFPNKIGTYLSAGVPILGFGHPATTLAEVMQRYRMGLFTSATQAEDLQKFFSHSLATPQPRAVFHRDILQCARAEFDAQAIRQRLWKTLGVS